MTIGEIIGVSLSVFFIAGTLLPLLRWDYWWIRVFDFPRTQLASLGILAFVLSWNLYDLDTWWHGVMPTATVLCVIYQGIKIWPYTPLHKKEVLLNKADKEDDRRISILVSNVLTPNRNSEKLLQLIRSLKPDLVLTLESDSWWQQQLDVLEKTHPYSVKIPLDNLYGMHLYSNLPLEDAQTLYLVRDDIPSIEALVKLRSGEKVKIYCLHPMPPSPTESDTSTERDGELLLVGKKVKKEGKSAIVFGDLNDVGWSYTTILFRKISGLLDPRIGRGMYNTFHAGYFFLRWPLDHVFHTKDFLLNRMTRLPGIGSDHFPVYADLQLNPLAEKVQEEPEANKEDQELAEEKIEKAEPILLKEKK